MEYRNGWLAAAGALAVAGAATAGGPQIDINEVRIDNPGADDEYFELRALPGTSLDGLTYLVIGDGTGGSGTIESVTDLTGNFIPSGGFFVVAEKTFTLGTPDLVAVLNFENSDNVTHLLVSGFTGADGDDLDTDDDGVLDVTPWTNIIDCVALVETVGSGDQIYCGETVGPDGTFVPGHAYRCTPDGTWTIGLFDTGGGTDTVGAANLACDTPLPCGAQDAGDCFEANGTPSCDDADCCDAVCVEDAFCCDVEWDADCAFLAQQICLSCGDPDAGNCFEPNGTLFCEDVECCTLVCNIDPTCCDTVWDESCAALAEAECLTPGEAPKVLLSEIRIDQPGADNEEYFELTGAPGTALDGVTYIVIGDNADGCGAVEAAIDLDGLSIPADGFFVGAEGTFSLAVADLVTDLPFENSDSVTHALVFNFTGLVGDDLDVDNDGTLDSMPWQSMIDSLGIVEGDTPDCKTIDFVYSSTTVGPDKTGVPQHVYLCTPDSVWVSGPLDPDGGDDTPGEANASCIGDPECGDPAAGSCIEANGTPNCDDAACCLTVCAIEPFCCDVEWDQSCADIALDVCFAKAPEVLINEVRIDQGGSDDDEYFELNGDPGTDLSNLTYIVIGDGCCGSGTVEAVVSLAGQTIPGDGFFVAAEDTFTLAFPDLITSLNFENSDNVTHLLVFNWTGENGADLDLDDDGVLDVEPWESVVDCVALIETIDEGEFTYCDESAGPDGDFVPAHAYRCTPDGTWTVGAFSIDDGTDTPGNPNLECTKDPGDCPADLDQNGMVGAGDLAELLASWGLMDVPADFDGGGVGASDLAFLLANWGPCP